MKPMDDYHSKYTQTNFISRRLLAGYFQSLRELVKPLELTSVLEVGCGPGYSTMELREMLPPAVSLEASDVDERGIREAQHRNPQVPIRYESAYELRRPDKSVDLVVLLEVLEHLDEPARALAEACRVSRKFVLAGVPREPLWRVLNLARLKYVRALGNTPGHVQHWSERSFRRMIEPYAEFREMRKPLPWMLVLGRARQVPAGQR